MDEQRNRCGIVLAGGEGKRLHGFIQRLRGQVIPKQYVNFIGTRSMLEHTYHRAEKLITPERLFTVVSQDHLRMTDVWRQISSRPIKTVISQPENKETGPGLLLPLMHLMKRYPGSTVAIFPSDHFILEEDLFMGYVDLACRAVESDPSLLILLGVQPHKPEPEYGYILPDQPTDPGAPSILRKVLGFIEKPDSSASEDLVQQGGLWNTMVMVFRAETLFDLVQKVLPELYRSFRQIFDSLGTPSEAEVVKQTYGQMESMNFSKAFLEVLSLNYPLHLQVMPVRGVFWNDWGSEERVLNVLQNMDQLYPDPVATIPLQVEMTGNEVVRS